MWTTDTFSSNFSSVLSGQGFSLGKFGQNLINLDYSKDGLVKSLNIQ